MYLLNRKKNNPFSTIIILILFSFAHAVAFNCVWCKNGARAFVTVVEEKRSLSGDRQRRLQNQRSRLSDTTTMDWTRNNMDGQDEMHIGNE